ncbi:MAG: hypothetical protein ACREVD_01040 [Burkholderiales bacterium]
MRIHVQVGAHCSPAISKVKRYTGGSADGGEVIDFKGSYEDYLEGKTEALAA